MLSKIKLSLQKPGDNLPIRVSEFILSPDAWSGLTKISSKRGIQRNGEENGWLKMTSWRLLNGASKTKPSGVYDESLIATTVAIATLEEIM